MPAWTHFPFTATPGVSMASSYESETFTVLDGSLLISFSGIASLLEEGQTVIFFGERRGESTPGPPFPARGSSNDISQRKQRVCQKMAYAVRNKDTTIVLRYPRRMKFDESRLLTIRTVDFLLTWSPFYNLQHVSISWEEGPKTSINIGIQC